MKKCRVYQTLHHCEIELIRKDTRQKNQEAAISRVLYPAESRVVIIHLRMPVARHLLQPTRKLRTGRPQTLPYLVLPRMGFTRPAMSPWQPVGSYPTFSPLPGRGRNLMQAVYFLWHFPWGHPRSALRTILPCVARTFLCGGKEAPQRSPAAS